MNDLNVEEIFKTLLEIAYLHKKMVDLFPEGNEAILKHLTASTVHLSLFANDLRSILANRKIPRDEELEKFLDKCGCDFNKKEENK
jgi:hypothetical protein